MSKRLLLLLPAGLLVQQVLPASDDIIIAATLPSEAATCPACGTSSRRVHSHYQRRLADLPWQGRP
ncbi:transposase family protein, partial [Roseomonas sp. B5]|uniref:transposase family protein n=1 Tax=Roseomonas sp. B5 TaxID=1217720 RepID=UPI00192AE991